MDAHDRRLLKKVRSKGKQAVFELYEGLLEVIAADWPGSYDATGELVRKVDPHANHGGPADNASTKKTAVSKTIAGSKQSTMLMQNIVSKQSTVPKQKTVPQMSFRASPSTQLALSSMPASVKDDTSIPILPNQHKKRGVQGDLRSFIFDTVEMKKNKMCLPKEPAEARTPIYKYTKEVKCDANDPEGYCKFDLCKAWSLTAESTCEHQRWKRIVRKAPLTSVSKGKSAMVGECSGQAYLQALDDDADDDEYQYVVKPKDEQE
ncbi:uncharacterized protein BKCO1_5000122 [Diplodia corticola]|uniref:Uncharacterized protein n=1 Tax=Diplodia corticola TaxID=236234 RepID=A0A1J9RC65_9PEZI|nr:uncharacterized protein BKCO1_5000122 [Diplodia corticola]OJD38049.1 hypothetical protein BKCO1_5000122 [Diplodia corticola]